MRKRFLTFILTGVLALSIIGCGAKENPITNTNNEDTITTNGTSTQDESAKLNDATARLEVLKVIEDANKVVSNCMTKSGELAKKGDVKAFVDYKYSEVNILMEQMIKITECNGKDKELDPILEQLYLAYSSYTDSALLYAQGFSNNDSAKIEEGQKAFDEGGIYTRKATELLDELIAK